MRMASWKLSAAIVCLYGFFKAMRPSEPYLTPYLTEPPINLTNTQVYNEVYPVWTYSYLVALIPVFLLTDLLRYKAVIVFEALCYIGTWLMLLFGRGVLTMQFMEFVYGFCTATEIAYYAYIYAAVEQEHYQKVAGYTRSSILVGKFIAAVTGQLLISFEVTDLYILNFISLGSVSVSLMIAILLPTVQHSMYFHLSDKNSKEMRSSSERRQGPGLDNPSFVPSNDNNEANHTNSDVQQEIPGRETPSDQRSPSVTSIDDEGRRSYVPVPRMLSRYTDVDTSSLAWSTHSGDQEGFSQSSVSSHAVEGPTECLKTPATYQPSGNNLLESRPSCCEMIKQVFLSLWRDFLSTYSKFILLKWSIWWAIASCGNFQVGNYIQNLWDNIDPNRDDPHKYNGAIEAAATLLGAILSFCIGLIPANWTAYGELLLGLVSMVNCAVLLVMAYTHDIWVAYCLYVVFRAAYQLVITVATFQIAKYLEVQRFGLVFGFNTFIALLLETVLTAIVVDKRGLNAPITTQFAVNGGYFGIMGLVFFVAAIINLSRRGCVSCHNGGELQISG